MMRLRSLNKRFFILCLAMAFLGYFSPNVAAQTPDRNVADGSPTEVSFHIQSVSSAPIKIVHIMVDDKEITPDTPVSVEGKWIGRLSIIVENISSKNIVECSIS